MGLIIFIAMGGIIGWLASVVMKIDDPQGVRFNILAGIGGAVAAGLASANGSILGAISSAAVLISVLGSITLLALLNLVRQSIMR